jgi:hypothetical protein
VSVTDVIEDQQPARPRGRPPKSVSKGRPRGRPPKARNRPPVAAPQSEQPGVSPLASDLLRGADAITEFIYGESDDQLRNQTYHLASKKVPAGRRLPVFHMGTLICARRSTIMRWIEAQERQAVSDAAESE